MKAKTLEARASVIIAQAEIPNAITEAYCTSNLGIMDYNKFQKIQAGIRKSNSISDPNKHLTGQIGKQGE